MQFVQNPEKVLIRIRNGSLAILFILLGAGTGMVGVGAATGIIQYLIDGGVFLMTSPIFLLMSMMARKKLKELGI